MRRILIASLTALLLTAGVGVAATSIPTKYQMCSLVNAAEAKANPGVEWSPNPLSWRYGRWGGPGWSNGSEQKSVSSGSVGIDEMDGLFKIHDRAYAEALKLEKQADELRRKAKTQKGTEKDRTLKKAKKLEREADDLEEDADDDLGDGLRALTNQTHKTWGSIYVSPAKDEGRPASVLVKVVEKGKKERYEKMPFSEFARRQAMIWFD